MKVGSAIKTEIQAEASTEQVTRPEKVLRVIGLIVLVLDESCFSLLQFCVSQCAGCPHFGLLHPSRANTGFHLELFEGEIANPKDVGLEACFGLLDVLKTALDLEAALLPLAVYFNNHKYMY